jgi:PadR family transcriptional regulator, regulatory protein AphA
VSAWLAEPTNDQMQVRDIAEMKLFFSELARPEDMRALAGQQVEQHQQRIAVYESMMTRFGHRPEYAGRVISLRLGLRIEHAALEFWTGYAAETRAGTTAEGDRQLRPSLWMSTGAERYPALGQLLHEPGAGGTAFRGAPLPLPPL